MAASGHMGDLAESLALNATAIHARKRTSNGEER